MENKLHVYVMGYQKDGKPVARMCAFFRDATITISLEYILQYIPPGNLGGKRPKFTTLEVNPYAAKTVNQINFYVITMAAEYLRSRWLENKAVIEKMDEIHIHTFAATAAYQIKAVLPDMVIAPRSMKCSDPILQSMLDNLVKIMQEVKIIKVVKLSKEEVENKFNAR